MTRKRGHEDKRRRGSEEIKMSGEGRRTRWRMRGGEEEIEREGKEERKRGKERRRGREDVRIGRDMRHRSWRQGATPQ